MKESKPVEITQLRRETTKQHETTRKRFDLFRVVSCCFVVNFFNCVTPEPVKFFIALLIFIPVIHAQTGGDFTITQSVIASGGGQNSSNGSFSLAGTIGQPLAETTQASGGVFRLQSGFWIAQLAPTAAGASLSGRVKTDGGKGIRNVQLTLTNTSSGETRTILSGAFGAYRFDDLSVGQTYILTVRAKRYTFAPDTRIFTLLEELTDVDFVGTSGF